MMVRKEEELGAKSWFNGGGEEVRSNGKVINTPELREKDITLQSCKE